MANYNQNVNVNQMMGFIPNPNGVNVNEQMLFQNQTGATIADVYSAIFQTMPKMGIPSTQEAADRILEVIQPQLADLMNRAEQSMINMGQYVEMLMKQNWSQLMQNERLRKGKRPLYDVTPEMKWVMGFAWKQEKSRYKSDILISLKSSMSGLKKTIHTRSINSSPTWILKKKAVR